MPETCGISSLAHCGGSGDGYGSLPTDFGVVEGLKINLLKSRLFGIGVFEEEVVNVVRAVNCSNDSLKVIIKIYEPDGGFNSNGVAALTKGPQKNIVDYCLNFEQLDPSLSNLIVKKIYNGNNTSFWLGEKKSSMQQLLKRQTQPVMRIYSLRFSDNLFLWISNRAPSRLSSWISWIHHPYADATF
nr:hypothetical protein [Tanacetum cinerariifolium]